MKVWRIGNRVSGRFFGEYAGETEDEALDALALDAGYDDYADMLARVPDATRDEVVVWQC